MEPTLSPGDFVLTLPRPLVPGFVYVVVHSRLGRMVKRLGPQGELLSDGEGAEPERLGPIGECEVLGRAVLAIRPRGLARLRRR